MIKTHKGELFCPTCSANLALGIDSEVAGEPPREFIRRTLYLYCPNQNCPQQYKRVELPEA